MKLPVKGAPACSSSTSPGWRQWSAACSSRPDFTRRDFGQALLAGGMLSHLPEQNAAPQPAASASAGSLIDVPGIRVGHFTDPRRPTGCTAILFDPDAAAGVDYATSAPGETGVVLLQPSSPVEQIHALFLTGGGLFGLPSFGGVIRY